MDLKCNCCILREDEKQKEYSEKMLNKYNFKNKEDKLNFIKGIAYNALVVDYEQNRKILIKELEIEDSESKNDRSVMDYYHCDICEECIVFFKFKEEKEYIEEKELKVLKTKDIIELAKDFIISQDKGIKSLSVIFSHQKLKMEGKIKSIHKNNPLVVGSTGSGKTYVLRTLSKLFNIPLITIPATAFTADGWSGANISEYFSLAESKKNGEYAIVLVDEFDKISSSLDSGMSSGGGSFNSLKQERLLTAIEGEISLSDSGCTIDTSKMLFVFAGAFQNLIKKKPKKEIGFKGDIGSGIQINKLTKRDIQNNGFKPELMGRISEVIQLNELTEEDYKEILLNTKDGYLDYYRELFKVYNTDLTLTDDVAVSLAKDAYDIDLGARTLNTVLFELLSDKLLESEDLDMDFNYKLELDNEFLKSNKYIFEKIEEKNIEIINIEKDEIREDFDKINKDKKEKL